MHTKAWALAGALLLTSFGAAEAQTAGQAISRTSDYTLSFSGPAFSGASAAYGLSFAYGDQDPFSESFNLQLLSNAQHVTFQDGGGVTVTPPAGPYSGAFDVTVASATGAAGFWGATYDTAATTNGPVLTFGAQGGLHTLSFLGGGSVTGTGYSDIGYFIYAHIPGNWTTIGTASGDLGDLSVDPSFGPISVTFDSGSDTTTVSAINGDYQSGGATNLSFTLFGGPAGVPEPATWAMMLMGFGGLGAAMRASRRAKALTA